MPASSATLLCIRKCISGYWKDSVTAEGGGCLQAAEQAGEWAKKWQTHLWDRLYFVGKE